MRVTDDQPGKLTGPTRVLLVDRDPGAGTLMDAMLRVTAPEGQVIARSASIADAGRDLRDHGASCVLLSVHGANDVEALARLRSEAPGVPIVAVADGGGEDLARRAMRIGAQDYVLKDEVSPTLLGRTVFKAVERSRTEVRRSHQALHDALTGLPNRSLFLDRLAVAIERSHRTGATLALLFVDVDHFKAVNDSLGHAAGDRVLQGLAERLGAALRPMDTVARYGGDEFTFLFEELAGEREALLIAERISRIVGRPISIEGREASITVSIGIAMAGGPGIRADTMIGEADAAMYRAKTLGRSRCEVFDESLRRRGEERVELETGLRNALARTELRVFYQPKVSVSDPGHLAGFEALVRWEHPERGLIAPGEFMPAAEASGLVQPIGEYVTREALAQLARWRKSDPDVTLSVNLSGRELQDERLAASLGAAIELSGNDPRALCLEITESALMHESEVARQVLRRLKGTGVRLAIDDYGTGYSSLLSLWRLPVDVIKIHESFVHGLASSAQQASLVHAMVDVAHALGIDTVAEGVETDAQLDEVRRLGCDGAQGFLFGRPVPAETAEALLTAN